MKRRILVALAAAVVCGTGATNALAKTYTVDDDLVDCPKAEFTSIQAAVTAAGPNDAVLVCSGTYVEQVVVGPGKDGLDLRSQEPLAAVIQAPPTIAADLVNGKAIVRITASQDVHLREFTIAGPGPGPCDSIRTGVRVDGGASATIRDNHVTQIHDTPFSGCQNGIGILVGRRIEGQVGSAEIFGNVLDLYQKGGIVVDGPGSYGKVHDNVTQGIGATPVIAQNGIQISRGAVGEVHSNEVYDHSYSLAPTFGSTGILLFEAASGTSLRGNVARRNDDNVGVYATSDADISGNTLTDSAFFDGVYVDPDSAGNHITGNTILDNKEHDCHDDSVGAGTAGTANFWQGNNALTENRPGLCLGENEGNA